MCRMRHRDGRRILFTRDFSRKQLDNVGGTSKGQIALEDRERSEMCNQVVLERRNL